MSANQVLPFALTMNYNIPSIIKQKNTFIDKGTIEEIKTKVLDTICYKIQRLNKCIEEINLNFNKAHNQLKSLKIESNNSNSKLKEFNNTISKKINNINTLEEIREFYNSSKEKGWKAEVFINEDWQDLSPTCEEVFEYYSNFVNNNNNSDSNNSIILKKLLALYLLNDINKLNEILSKQTSFKDTPEYTFIKSLLEIDLNNNKEENNNKFCEISYNYDKVNPFDSDVTNLLLEIKDKYFE